MASYKISSHILVLIQFSGIALSVIKISGSSNKNFIFLSLVALGIILGFITLFYNRFGNFRIYPEPKQNMILITTGPYRYIRHPMYSALLLMMAGFSFYNGDTLNYIGLLMVTLAVYGKAIKEEELIAKKFSEYQNYISSTWRFFPFIF